MYGTSADAIYNIRCSHTPVTLQYLETGDGSGPYGPLLDAILILFCFWSTIMAQKPAVLTLDPAVGIISEKENLVAYTIRQFFATPGGYSDLFKDAVISFRDIKAKCNTDLNATCEMVKEKLSDVLSRLLPTEHLLVSVITEPYVENGKTEPVSDGRYTLVINIRTSTPYDTYEPILTTARVSVVNGVFTVNLVGDDV